MLSCHHLDIGSENPDEPDSYIPSAPDVDLAAYPAAFQEDLAAFREVPSEDPFLPSAPFQELSVHMAGEEIVRRPYP
tara:strand:- start:1059 stop:1289 length:231 start_codon:yes stop_codon:yes gene_type:complete